MTNEALAEDLVRRAGLDPLIRLRLPARARMTTCRSRLRAFRAMCRDSSR